MSSHHTSLTSSAPLGDTETFVAYTHFEPLERWLEHQHRKVPITLPAGWAQNLPRVAPWVWLALLPFKVFTLFALFGVTVLSAVFGSLDVLLLLVGLISFGCEVVALPGLFKRTRRGWAFTLYSSLLWALDSLLSLNLLGIAVSAVVLWIAMAVKPEYRH